MPREIVGKGLRFSLRHAPCARICRYCLISESRKRSTLPFARFEQLVHRFHDWKQSTRRDDFQIGIFVGPSFDYDLETLRGIARLHARRGAKFQILNLGGLRMRSGEALIEWLEERRAAGITGFHASLAGYVERARRRFRLPDFDPSTGRRARHGSPRKAVSGAKHVTDSTACSTSSMAFQVKSVAAPPARFSAPAWQSDMKVSA
jgi:hypothetical protein